MEHQIDFLGRDKNDIKWENIQFRLSPEMKRDFELWCVENHIRKSVMLRLIIAKIINNCREISGIMGGRKDTLKEIDMAANEVVGYLPVISKQMRHNRRKY